MRTGMPAHLCQERSPCAVRAPPVRTRAGRPRTRRKPQVRAPPVRTRAGRPRTRRKPQVRAPPVRTRAGRAARQELDAEFRTSGAHAGRTPALPAQTSGARALAGSGLLASPGVPSFLSGIRTPKLPLLPQGEQGARGMRGQTHTGMQKITHRSKNSTLEKSGDEGQTRTGARHTARCSQELSPCAGGRRDQGDDRSISGDR